VLAGGAGAYLYLIPSYFDETIVASPPVAEAAVALAQTPQVTATQQAATTPEQPPVTPEAAAASPAPAVTVAEEPAPVAAETAETIAKPAADATAQPSEEAALETEVVAAQADVTEPEPAVEAAAPAMQSVEDFIAEWTAHWQSKDLDAYLASYHADFAPPQDATRAAWEEQRRRVITNAVNIMVSAEAPESTREAQDGMRLVRFWLNYSAANYADRTLKELLLVPVDGSWRIRIETNLRTERP
jgi:hypothetical protein